VASKTNEKVKETLGIMAYLYQHEIFYGSGGTGTNEYSIKVNGNVITCAGYSETMIKIPLRPEHKETLGEVAKYAFNLFTGTHLFSTYDPNDEELEYMFIEHLLHGSTLRFLEFENSL
jgi:hypothetical protein